MHQAAVVERAEHPEHHLDRGERVRRQVEGKRRQHAGEAGDRRSGQDQRHRAAARAGQQQNRQRGQRGAGEPADRQRQRERRGRAGVDRNHRSEGSAAGDAQQAGLGQWIAQISLQRGAGEPEHGADQGCEHGPRQPDLAEDQPGRGTIARQAEAGRPDEQRCDQGDREQARKPGICPEAALSSGRGVSAGDRARRRAGRRPRRRADCRTATSGIGSSMPAVRSMTRASAGWRRLSATTVR